jgi:hypothetical protein
MKDARVVINPITTLAGDETDGDIRVVMGSRISDG